MRHIKQEINGRGLTMLGNLRHLRRMRDLTQEQLAKLSGVSRINIARYESGKITPSLLNAQKLAIALGVTVTDLMTAKENG